MTVFQHAETDVFKYAEAAVFEWSWDFCHPGRRPGIHCAALPLAIVGSGSWIPDQVRYDRQCHDIECS